MSGRPTAFELLEQLRDQHQMRIAHHRAGDAIHVFVPGSDREASRRLPESRVDHVDAAVPHQAGDELDASVMAVESHLAQEDSGSMGKIAATIDLFDGGGGFGGRTHDRWNPAEARKTSGRVLEIELGPSMIRRPAARVRDRGGLFRQSGKTGFSGFKPGQSAVGRTSPEVVGSVGIDSASDSSSVAVFLVVPALP